MIPPGIGHGFIVCYQVQSLHGHKELECGMENDKFGEEDIDDHPFAASESPGPFTVRGCFARDVKMLNALCAGEDCS